MKEWSTPAVAPVPRSRLKGRGIELETVELDSMSASAPRAHCADRAPIARHKRRDWDLQVIRGIGANVCEMLWIVKDLPELIDSLDLLSAAA